MSNVTVRNKLSAVAKPPVVKNIEKHHSYVRSPSTSRIASSTNLRSVGNISSVKAMNNIPRKTGSCQNLSNLSNPNSSQIPKSKYNENFYSINNDKATRNVARSNTNNSIGTPPQHTSNIPSNSYERYKQTITPSLGNGNIRTATNNSFATHSIPSTNGSFYNGYNENKPSKSRIYVKNHIEKSASSGSSSNNSPEASGNTVSNSLSNSEGYNTTNTSSMGTNTTTHSSFTHSSSSDNCNKYNSDSYFNTTQNRNPLPRSETMKSLNNSLNEQLGLVGLVNLGNTCFMNSVLQCLSNCKPLQEYCLSSKYEADLNTNSKSNGSLFKSYADLMKSIWKSDSESYVSPDKFKRIFQKLAPAFHVTSQQDSQEFLRLMLEGLHQDVNKVRRKSKSIPITDEESEKLSDKELAELHWSRYVKVDDSFIVDLFVGQLKSTLRCNKCGYRSITFDPFWDLSLPIPKVTRNQISLTDCLNLFTTEEILDGDEMPKCFKCKTKRPCTKRFSIHKFPSILVIHLKRFSGDRYRSKISSFIEFPTRNLNLQSNAEPSTFASYNLYAVSNHSGTVDGGHYTAYCCNPSSKNWYKYDDTRVFKVNENSVCSTEAYVLFYQMTDKNVHFGR